MLIKSLIIISIVIAIVSAAFRIKYHIDYKKECLKPHLSIYNLYRLDHKKAISGAVASLTFSMAATIIFLILNQ